MPYNKKQWRLFYDQNAFFANPPPLRSICIIALILSLCACSLVNDLTSERASLSFTITGELADRINSASSSRSATLADSGLYLDIALEGNYEDEKTIPISEGSTVKFENIPTGLSLYATAQAYEMDGGEKFVFYEGESEKITIQEGENALSLFLQKVESDIIRYYISANAEAGGNGSKAKPFQQLANAVEKINDSTKTYWLIIDGSLAGKQLLVDDDQIGEVYQAKAIVIKGNSENGADGINANNENRALTIGTAVPVTIKNLTITGGNMTADGGDGGGLYVSNGANVTIAEGTIITGNQAERGGGVFVDGTLKMTGGIISNNTASKFGGGVCLEQSQTALFTMTGGEISNNTVNITVNGTGNGGAIWVGQWVSKIELSNAKISGNTAENNGGGIYIGDTNGGTHTISGCTISGNSAGTYGGGIYLDSSLTLTINNSTISGNTAELTNGNDIWKGLYANLPNGPENNPPNVYYAE